VQTQRANNPCFSEGLRGTGLRVPLVAGFFPFNPSAATFSSVRWVGGAACMLLVCVHVGIPSCLLSHSAAFCLSAPARKNLHVCANLPCAGVRCMVRVLQQRQGPGLGQAQAGAAGQQVRGCVPWIVNFYSRKSQLPLIYVQAHIMSVPFQQHHLTLQLDQLAAPSWHDRVCTLCRTPRQHARAWPPACLANSHA
jgi:hypothetical protein